MEVTRNGVLGPNVLQVVELVNIRERAPALILPQVPAGRTAQAWVQTKILSSAATTIAQVNKFEIINKEWTVPQSWSWRILFHWIPSDKRMKNRIPQGYMIPQYYTVKLKLPTYC